MRYFLLFVSLFFSEMCFSATRLQFFIGDRNALAILTPADPYGNSDTDSSDLYQTMNVPEQNTMLGKGKSIVSPERDFNLVCGEYKNQCQVIINKSPNTIISGSDKKMRYMVQGNAAALLTQQFKLNSSGEAYFRTTDKTFRLNGNTDTFIFEASPND